MKASRVKRIVSIILASFFVLSMLSVTAVEAKERLNAVSGTVVSVNADAGKLSLIDKAGRTFKLQAQPDKNPKVIGQLKTIQEGDKVKVEFDEKGIIKSVNIEANR